MRKHRTFTCLEAARRQTRLANSLSGTVNDGMFFRGSFSEGCHFAMPSASFQDDDNIKVFRFCELVLKKKALVLKSFENRVFVCVLRQTLYIVAIFKHLFVFLFPRK